MAVELEGLEFQIEAKSNTASKGIDALITSFTKLKGAISGKGLDKVAEKLDTINRTINQSGIDKLGNLANALNTLNSVNIPPAIPKRLSAISAALDSITPESIDRAERLSVALQGMDGVNIPNLSGLNSGAGPAPTGGGDTDSAGAHNAPNDVADATGEIVRATNAAQIFKNVLHGLGGVFSKTFSVVGKGALKSLQLSFKAALVPLKAVVDTGKKLITTFGSRLANSVKKVTSGFGKLFASIKRIALYRLIRFMFSQLSKAIKEGTNNLYQYSLMFDGKFSRSMDSCATSFLYLKNSMGAMVGPLINSLAPALDFIIDKVVALMNLFNQFIARLTGAKTFTAAKKMATSYGESAEDAANKTKKAAKEIKDATGSIDELNIISQNDRSGGGDSGTDYGSMFEELPIDSVISDFADKLKQAFESQQWDELGKLLGTKFNEIIDGIDWAGIGRKIGNFLDGAIKTAYHFLKTADFYGLGRHLAELINNALTEIDGEYIGRLLVRYFTAGLDFLIGLIDGMNWTLLGKTVGNAIQGAVSEAYEWLQQAGDFSRFGEYIAEALNNVLSAIDCEMLGRTLVKVLAALPNILIGFVRTFDWKLFGESVGDCIKGALNEMSDWIKEVDWSQLAHDLYTGLKNTVIGLDFTGIAQAFFRYFGSALAAAVSLIGTFIADVITDIKNYFLQYIQDENGDGKFGGIEIVNGLLLGIWDGIKNIGTWIKENVFDPFIQGVKDCFGIHSPSTVMQEIGHYIVEGLLIGITETWHTIPDFFGKVVGEIVSFFKGKWDEIKNFTAEIWAGIKQTLGETWENIKTSAGEKFEAVKEKIGTAWENTKTATSEKWESIKTTLSSTWETLKTTAGQKFEEVRRKVNDTWENIKREIPGKWEEIKTSIKGKWDDIVFSAKSWGSDLCDSLASGISSGIRWVQNAVRDVADTVSSYLHFSEPDVGPLSNFHTFMPDMLKLMSSGIRDNAYLAENAVYDLTDSIAKTLDKSKEDFEMPISTKSNVRYITDYGERFSQDSLQSEEFVASMRSANGEVVSALYAIAGQLVNAIEEVADRPVEVELDSKRLTSQIEKTQRERGRMIMSGGVVT